MPSRFLEEVPSRLVEDLGSPPAQPQFGGGAYSTPYPQRNRFGKQQDSDQGDRHYSYEDEDQSGGRSNNLRAAAMGRPPQTGSGSMDNIASFFAARGQKFTKPKLDVPEQTGKTGLAKGARVRHPKYGEGMVFQREGEGDDAKITVNFAQHGVKKLIERFAQLERL